MKRVLYILNDCMRKFSYERSAGLLRALKKIDADTRLYIYRSDAYAGYTPEHNAGEYNIYRMPAFSDYDAILLDINNVFVRESDSVAADGMRYVVEAAAASGKPVISMSNDIGDFYCAGIDNYFAMQAVTAYFHEELGLKDFWFAMGPKDNYENVERMAGIRDYCESHGISCGEDRFFSESFIVESGQHAFSHFFESFGGSLPEAVICANDHIAFGVCRAASAAGFQVPRDFLVSGFDNTEESALFSPTITTVDQLCWNMGTACAGALAKIWNGENIPRRIKLPTKLVLRESTGHQLTSIEELHRYTSDGLNLRKNLMDFNYKISMLQYTLPGCKTIGEIGDALKNCLSSLDCGGFVLILDNRLFDSERLLAIRSEEDVAMIEMCVDMPVEGYSVFMEQCYSWEREDGGAEDSVLYAPLHFMQYTVGCLRLSNCLELIRIQGVSSIVSTLTMALRTYFTGKNLSYMNTVLSGISMKDDLTGLYNRLGYHDLANAYYREACEKGEQVAVIFIDMDKLKYINDNLGHAYGDLAIRSVANAIRACLPEHAIGVRYGGDEFLAITAGMDSAGTERMLEQLEGDIAEQAAALGVPSEVSVSSGFVMSDPGLSVPLEEYVREADEKMYDIKERKRVRTGSDGRAD